MQVFTSIFHFEDAVQHWLKLTAELLTKKPQSNKYMNNQLVNFKNQYLYCIVCSASIFAFNIFLSSNESKESLKVSSTVAHRLK